METRRQGTALLTALATLVAVLVVIQLWLVAAALDALLAGDTTVLIPAALASLFLLAINVGALWHVTTYDRRLRRLDQRASR